jgi:hypothetical protein
MNQLGGLRWAQKSTGLGPGGSGRAPRRLRRIRPSDASQAREVEARRIACGIAAGEEGIVLGLASCVRGERERAFDRINAPVPEAGSAAPRGPVRNGCHLRRRTQVGRGHAHLPTNGERHGGSRVPRARRQHGCGKHQEKAGSHRISSKRALSLAALCSGPAQFQGQHLNRTSKRLRPRLSCYGSGAPRGRPL